MIVACSGVTDWQLLCLLVGILMLPKDFSKNKSLLIPCILIQSDTHRRWLWKVQNGPQTAKNIPMAERNGRYLLEKGSKDMANYSQIVEVHQFSYTKTVTHHFSIDSTPYEACQNTHIRSV